MKKQFTRNWCELASDALENRSIKSQNDAADEAKTFSQRELCKNQYLEIRVEFAIRALERSYSE